MHKLLSLIRIQLKSGMLNTMDATTKTWKKALLYLVVLICMLPLLGLLFLGLGAIGVIIPIIPTTPFLLLTSFFFLRSSERLNTWFEGTRMYKRFIANFMETRSLTLRAKILCAAPGVTAMPMLALVVPQWWLKAILIGLTVFEIWYFIVRIETVSVEEARARGKARVAEAKRDQAASAASAAEGLALATEE